MRIVSCHCQSTTRRLPIHTKMFGIVLYTRLSLQCSLVSRPLHFIARIIFPLLFVRRSFAVISRFNLARRCIFLHFTPFFPSPIVMVPVPGSNEFYSHYAAFFVSFETCYFYLCSLSSVFSVGCVVFYEVAFFSCFYPSIHPSIPSIVFVFLCSARLEILKLSMDLLYRLVDELFYRAVQCYY